MLKSHIVQMTATPSNVACGTHPGLHRCEEAAHRRADIVARYRQRDVRLDKAGLVAAIVTLAIEGEAMERLVADQLRHRVGQLDLAAGALFLRLQDAHHLGLKDVAARDHQV
jgi:hypothetical protein